ncbi:hypothetical protein Hanom_Chr12g01086101 [Helianthus anomalus]
MWVFTYSSQSPNIQIHGFITAESQKKPWRLISSSTQSSSMFNDIFLSFRFESTLRLFPVDTCSSLVPGTHYKRSNGKCFYDVNPLDISENENFKNLRFQRVVFFMPTEPKIDEVDNLLDRTKHLLQDFDQKAQIHLFASKKTKYYAWELETIVMKYDLVYHGAG